jgi:hypothetical protein
MFFMILGDRVVTKVEQGVHKGKFSVGDVDWPLYLVLKTKQIGIKHTQEGIGHSSQPAGQVKGEQKEGRKRRKSKKHQGVEEKPRHGNHTKPEQHSVRNQNFTISVGMRGSSSMGRRLRGESAMQTRQKTRGEGRKT